VRDLNLIPLSVVVLLALAMRRLEGSWYGPSAFFGLYWSAFLCAIYIFLPDFTLTLPGVTWILCAYCALIVGGLISRTRPYTGPRPQAVQRRAAAFNERRVLVLLVLVCSAATIAATPVLTAAAGVPLQDLTSGANFIQVAGYYTSNRYNDPSFREPAWGIALYSFAYVGSILAGRLFVVGGTLPIRLMTFLPLACAGFLATLMTTRSLVLVSLLYWATGYMISCVLGGAYQRQIITLKKLRLFLTFCAVAIALFIGGQLVRAGGSDKVDRSAIYASVATSFLGSTSSFTMWFSDTAGGQLPEYGWGTRTLSGPLNWVLPGFKRSSIATFDAIIVGNGSALGEDTTVATLFRELIYDFTPAGSLLLLCALGSFGTKAYAACMSGGIRRSAGLATYYLIVLYSMMGFIYKFTTLMAVSLAFLAYCRYAGKRLAESEGRDPQVNAGRIGAVSGTAT
jgi:oligosaccharide repeat unit polymerase